jgi:AraC-like DNA-binding protein
MLESGDFDSIKEVALSAGYSDPLYFSKVFKKFYGFSPSSLNE